MNPYSRKKVLTKLFPILSILIFGSVMMSGQIADSLVHKNPNAVIYNHLYYLQPEQYEPERAALSFPPQTKKAVDKAIKLKQILDGKGLYVDIHRIPHDPDFMDSLSNEHIYYIDRDEPLIYVERIDSNWYYSRTTIASIPDLHSQIFPFGSGFSTYFTAPVWEVKVLGIRLWKIVGFTLILGLTIILYSLINFISKKLVRSILKKRFKIGSDYEKNVKYLSRLISLYLGTKFILYLLPILELPIQAQALLVKILNVLSIFFVLFIFVQIIQIIFKYAEKFTEQTTNTLDDQLMPVVRRLILIVLWIFGAFYILDYLDVNVTALIAGISIGGLAIALAAQDTVKNFFGSIMIFIDKPFQIGDAISFSGVGGVVEEVGVRSTRIRTFQNSLTYVPNGMLADAVVDNLGLRQFRRFKTEIGITYDTSPENIDLFVQGIREILESHSMTKKDSIEVHMHDFGPSSINILLYVFLDVAGWTDELKTRHQLMYAIIVLADKLGVEFAFPTQTVHIESLPDDKQSNQDRKTQTGDSKLEKSMDQIRKYFKDSSDPSE